MNSITLNNYVIRVGTGQSKSKLNAFDRALIGAGVSDYNLIKVSSVLPPHCQLQSKISLKKGLLLPSAFVSIYSDAIGDVISAAVAIGIPEDDNEIGVIMKYSGCNSKELSEQTARSFAVEALNDRKIYIGEITSISIECKVEVPEFYCAFATVSMW